MFYSCFLMLDFFSSESVLVNDSKGTEADISSAVSACLKYAPTGVEVVAGRSENDIIISIQSSLVFDFFHCWPIVSVF